MSGGVVFLILCVIVVVGYAVLVVQRTRAENMVFIEVEALDLSAILEIGTKKSLPWHAAVGGGGHIRPAVRQLAGGIHEWDRESASGTMTFRVIPIATGGYQVGGSATAIIVFQLPEPRISSPASLILALPVRIMNGVTRALRMPKSPGALLRQRRRVLKAVAAAE